MLCCYSTHARKRFFPFVLLEVAKKSVNISAICVTFLHVAFV